ncbi:tetratricopeptide repeat protein [Streptomyces sp. NPDC059447]|uniref:tetratricopeptide repeat protein n=1 Tax=Streptomyces sp. NPDC059447 TaxID=3346834 RepID=UPI00367448EB
MAEQETLIEDLEQLDGANRRLLLWARLNRAWVLIDEGRPGEAEVEALVVLRSLTRLAHLTEVWRLELSALQCLGHALCAQDEYQEAETIARGNLPRAEQQPATGLHRLLIRSLSGQGRHEEALTESRRTFPELPPSDSGELELARAVALHALGRPGEAETEARRALAACERYLHPAHPRVGEVHALLARIASA